MLDSWTLCAIRNMKKSEKLVGTIGILSVIILVISILIFGFLNNNFSFINDFISKLGAKEEPNALWFNLIAFVIVGILLCAFGLTYRILLKDRFLCVLLSLFGLGFAFTVLLIDLEFSKTSVSKVHILDVRLFKTWIQSTN